jgi:hypothetical protein
MEITEEHEEENRDRKILRKMKGYMGFGEKSSVCNLGEELEPRP